MCYGILYFTISIIFQIYCPVPFQNKLPTSEKIGIIRKKKRTIPQMPEEIVTMIMLMHRYLMLLIKEVERMQQAYKLRAPKQKGLQFLTWGSFNTSLFIKGFAIPTIPVKRNTGQIRFNIVFIDISYHMI